MKCNNFQLRESFDYYFFSLAVYFKEYNLRYIINNSIKVGILGTDFHRLSTYKLECVVGRRHMQAHELFEFGHSVGSACRHSRVVRVVFELRGELLVVYLTVSIPVDLVH